MGRKRVKYLMGLDVRWVGGNGTGGRHRRLGMGMGCGVWSHWGAMCITYTIPNLRSFRTCTCTYVHTQ